MTQQPDTIVALALSATTFVKFTVDVFAYSFNVEGRYKIPLAMLLGTFFSALITLTIGGTPYFLSLWPSCILAGVLAGAAASGMTELQKKVEALGTQKALIQQLQTQQVANGTDPSVCS